MNEFFVNSKTSLVSPAIQWLGGDSFVVVWTDFGNGHLKGARFSPSGAPISLEFPINGTDLSRGHPAIAPLVGLSSPGFVVAWTTETENLQMQRFDAEGAKSSGVIQANTRPVDPDHSPALTTLFDGNVVVVWGDEAGIRGQIFEPDGSRNGTEFNVSSSQGIHTTPTITQLDDAGFVVAWDDNPDAPGGFTHFQFFNPDGSKSGAELIPTHELGLGPSTMTFIDVPLNQLGGNFANVRLSSAGSDDEQIVVVETFGPQGALVSGVNVTHKGDGTISSSPALRALPNSRMIVTWMQKPVQTTGQFNHSIMAMLLALQADGSLVSRGPAVQIDNTGTLHGQDSPCIGTTLGEGLDRRQLVGKRFAFPTSQGACAFDGRDRIGLGW
jgi:hypothetical protein